MQTHCLAERKAVKEEGGEGRNVNEQKLNTILEAMKGITYLEWKKLKHSIDNYFQIESSKQNNEIPLTGANIIIEEFKHYSSTI